VKKLFVVFALFILLGGCDESTSTNLTIDPEPTLVAKELPTIKPVQAVQKDKPVITTAKIVAIGDILLHQSVYDDAATPQGTYEFTPMFLKVKPFLESADLAIANQETMIGGTELGLSSYPMFNSPFEIGDALKEAGIDLVTLANNHTLDRGEKAINNALDHWESIGMPYTGSFKSEEDRATIRTIQKNDITFSFLSYSYGTNGMPVPEDKPYLINLIDLPLIEQDVAKAKELSDVVVVSMHWGNEYEAFPSTEQMDLAEDLSEMGVDIIIGHHPHVLQPMDWIDRSDGSKTFVLYSLGNFLSAQEGLERLIGGIGGVEITKTVYQGESLITLDNPSFVCTYVHSKNWKDYEIIPMYQLSEGYLPSYQQHYERTQDHMRNYTNEVTFVENVDEKIPKDLIGIERRKNIDE